MMAGNARDIDWDKLTEAKSDNEPPNSNLNLTGGDSGLPHYRCDALHIFDPERPCGWSCRLYLHVDVHR